MNLIILSVGVLCVCAISAGPTGSKRVEGAHKERGILHGHKPVVKDVSSHIIGPNEENDGCKRQYPLTPNKVQQVPLAFNQYGISPALTAPPPGYVDVHYERIIRCQPYLGNEVDVCSLEKVPNEVNWRCSNNILYTLVLIDLYPMGQDRPNLLSQGILWWVVDIPCSGTGGGKTIIEYRQPLPFFGAGKGKYAFLVYEQPRYAIDWSEEPLVTATSEKYRYFRCWDRLVYKYDLKLVAGNFFLTQYNVCIERIRAGLDVPKPQYIVEAINKADLPNPLTVRQPHYYKLSDANTTVANVVNEEVPSNQQRTVNMEIRNAFFPNDHKFKSTPPN